MNDARITASFKHFCVIVEVSGGQKSLRCRLRRPPAGWCRTVDGWRSVLASSTELRAEAIPTVRRCSVVPQSLPDSLLDVSMFLRNVRLTVCLMDLFHV